jgi:hypothetical protein
MKRSTSIVLTVVSMPLTALSLLGICLVGAGTDS